MAEARLKKKKKKKKKKIPPRLIALIAFDVLAKKGETMLSQPDREKECVRPLDTDGGIIPRVTRPFLKRFVCAW